MKKVMVLPGTEFQIPLIIKLRERGCKVIVVNPERTKATTLADIYEKADILDKDTCFNIAKRHGIKGVFSDQCDIAIPVVTYISEKLGLSSIGAHIAALYTDKSKMREFAAANNFPCPKYKKCESIQEAEEFFLTIKSSKMIIKPIDSNSSRGVFTITNRDEIKQYFFNSLKFSKSCAFVLCEEYIEGTEFTVDGIVINGIHHSLAISRKKHFSFNTNIAYELYFSSEEPEFDYNKLSRLNDEYISLTGLPFGLTHAEYKYDGNKFIQIEIGARGGGNYISSHIVPQMVEIDTYDYLIDSVLGINVEREFSLENLKKKFAVLKFFDLKDRKGKILSIEGEEILKNSPEVILYQFRVKKGQIIEDIDNDSMRIGFYIAISESQQILNNLILSIESNVNFIIEH